MRAPLRHARAGFAALAVVGLVAVAPATAGADSHHRHRHHHFTLTDVQKTCLAAHGFPVGVGAPRPDLRDPAVRAAVLAALRDCGIIPARPPTTTPPPPPPAPVPT